MKRKIQSPDFTQAERAQQRALRKLRESDPPEGDDDTQGSDKPLCTHKTQRGATFLSKHCPNCGAQLRWDDDEVRASQVKGDLDKVSERARFNNAKSAALKASARKR